MSRNIEIYSDKIPTSSRHTFWPILNEEKFIFAITNGFEKKNREENVVLGRTGITSLSGWVECKISLSYNTVTGGG